MTFLPLPNRLIRPVVTSSSRAICIRTARVTIQRRLVSSNSSDPELHPILQDYYKNRPSKLQEAITGQNDPQKTEFGAMPKKTIFDQAGLKVKEEDEAPSPKEDPKAEIKDFRSLDALNLVLDPLPHKRWQWERLRIIKDARRGWRLTKSEYLQRTERRSASNSRPLKTSRKKLALLASQISGKSIDEALLQLRFSKKRSATEVAKHLEQARDHAIVRWGMSLGEVEDRKGEPVTIKLKDGKRRQITDRTALYIEHAMVRSRKPELQPEYRARGKMNILRKPYTSLRIVLKEEHTRIRECQEREERKLRKTPFEPLADKPITQQRQYVLW